MTMDADTFIDTNILLAATAPNHPHHSRALIFLNDLFARGKGVISGQVLREYYCVATRPVTSRGLGLSQRDALRNIKQFRERTQILEESKAVHLKLFELLDEFECVGKQVHDTNIVATTLEHGVTNLATFNVKDFQRFGSMIQTKVPK